MHYIRKFAGTLLGLNAPGGSVRVRRTDSFVTSYPRSGNTWALFMITAMLRPGAELSFELVHKVVPDIYTTSAVKLRLKPSPRILKSHEAYNPRYPTVIYLVRDPRDVAISYFYYLKKMKLLPQSATLSTFVPSFASGEIGSFGAWGDHVMSWLNSHDSHDGGSFLLLRYEDLVDDPHRQVQALSRILGHSLSRAEAETVVRRTSFSSMRRAEADALQSGASSLRPLQASSTSSWFVRSGRVGGWRSELSLSQQEIIASKFAEPMSRLGYT